MRTARRYGNYIPSSAMGVRVRTDRRVNVLAVPCGTCGAPVGEQCSIGTGHATRRRVALREEMRTAPTFSVEDLNYPLRFTPTRRRQIRRRRRISQAVLADRLDVPVGRLRAWERGESLPLGPGGAAYGSWLRDRVEGGAE